MKTNYPTIQFRQDVASWRCEDSDGHVLGDIVQNHSTGEWRFLTLGSVFLDARMCRDIAYFLGELTKKGSK